MLIYFNFLLLIVCVIAMDHYMPEIFWHDRKALLSVDVHPEVKNGKYKIVTASVQKEIRIWEYEFEQIASLEVSPLAVDFVANLAGHNAAINTVKFSRGPGMNVLASGDCDGRVSIWKLSDDPPCGLSTNEDLPPNKENWQRVKVLNHDSDVTSLTWSPDGTQIATVSNDESMLVHEALTGKRVLTVRNLRHFPNGVAWDPRGRYIVTMSTDRKMDLIDANKGTRLRVFGAAELPAGNVSGLTMEAKMYKFFHDDQLMSFQRGVSFSPCGEIIVAPCGHLEIGSSDLYGTFVFKRAGLEKDMPTAFMPSPKPTFLVRFSPVMFELDKDCPDNYLGLPYRLIWLALTKDSVMFYDSQHRDPIGHVYNIHYNSLTDAMWTPDGCSVVISSLEGYCSFLKMNMGKWGTTVERSELPHCPPSPQIIQVKKKRAPKEKKEGDGTLAKDIIMGEKKSPDSTEKEQECVTPKMTPVRKQPKTPKSGGLLKFLKKDTPSKEGSGEPNNTVNINDEKQGGESFETSAPVTPSIGGGVEKKKKRVQLITLDE